MNRPRMIRRAALLSMVCGWAALASDQLEPRLIIEVQETYAATSAVFELHFDPEALGEAGLSLGPLPSGSLLSRPQGRGSDQGDAVSFDLVETDSMFQLVAGNGELRALLEGAMAVSGEPFTLIAANGRRVTIDALHLKYDPHPDAQYELSAETRGMQSVGLAVFDFSGLNMEFEHDDGSFILDADVRISNGLAAELGVEDAAGRIVGVLLLNARMALTQWIDVDQDGAAESAVMYPVEGGTEAAGDFVPSEGPDVIVSTLHTMAQLGRDGAFGSGTVGLAVGTVSCNVGDVPLDWFAFASTNHPMIPQNLYRLRTIDGSNRFEQIGQGWMKHAFLALAQDGCSPPLGCISPGTGTLLGVGCSDPYSTGLNAVQCLLGPRAAVNPYTGLVTSGLLVEPPLGSGGGCSSNYTSKNHLGHVNALGDPGHDGIAHRVQVQDVDLMPSMNPGARYFTEGQYVTPHEFAEANGNQFNNVSYRETRVTLDDKFPDRFKFENVGVGSTVQQQPAVNAWPGAIQTPMEPDPGNDGLAILAYEVTDLGNDRWHYEYALYNMNLDRSIWRFSVPVPPGVEITNTGFHAPLNHAPVLNTDTHSNVPWSVDLSAGAATFSTTSFIVNPLANAIRFGTLYNFRFDADSPPIDVNATVGMFKTGEFVMVATQGPATLEPPEIVHGSAGVAFASHAFTGHVDPRMESSNGFDLDMGISVITIRFSQQVEAIGGGPLTMESFFIRQTGDDPPPVIDAISASGNPTVRISLDRIISLQEWTTIEARVQNLAGIAIPNVGDLGPGVPEPDRIDFGFLPGETEKNGRVEPLDLIRFRQYVSGQKQAEIGASEDFVDTNRDGSVTPEDLIQFRDLLFGTGNATQAWKLTSMNHPQP